MKVAIIIITYNISAEVFLLQIAALKKFCKDEFEIQVIDNSSDPEIAEHIRYHSSVHGIAYTKTFAGGKGSSDSHAFAANFAFQKLKDEYELFFFIDHDAIPIKEFSVVSILAGGHVAAGIGQEKRKKYFWPGCFMLNAAAVDKDIIDFSPREGLDTGGGLHEIIDKYGEEACVFFNESYHQNPDYVSKEYGHYAMIMDLTFLHFIAGSNWVDKADHQRRISSLVNIAKAKTGL